VRIVFKSGVPLFQVARQRLPLLFCNFAFSDVADYAYVLAIARAILSGVGDHVEVPEDTVRQEDSILNI
jgi:hypothetical protein